MKNPKVIHSVKQLKDYLEGLPDTLELKAGWRLGCRVSVGKFISCGRETVTTPILNLDDVSEYDED